MILHLSKQIEATRVRRIQRQLALAMTLTFLSELVGLGSLSGIPILVLMLVIWSGFYMLMFQALKRMLYSFLTMVIILCIFNFAAVIIHAFDAQWIKALIYMTNFIVVGSIIITINRPIFFPKINWTEYDFRHRRDRRVKVRVSSDVIENARLYDTRRGEAALMSFTELDLDSEYMIEDMDGTIIGSAKVISQRKTLLGRPITHGIRLQERK